MKRYAAFLSISATLCVLLVSPSQAQTNPKNPISAVVYPDSTGEAVVVKNLKLDFQFAGYGIYRLEEYPSVTHIPLETGERIKFQYAVEATFTGKRVEWKKFVEPEKRDEYENIDENGYRHWNAVEVQTTILDLDGKKISSRIDRPEYAHVILKGTTSRGDFKLQLDQENGKTVRVLFKPATILQCTKNPNHVYPNSDWKFCPECGGSLKSVPIPDSK